MSRIDRPRGRVREAARHLTAIRVPCGQVALLAIAACSKADEPKPVVEAPSRAPIAIDAPIPDAAPKKHDKAFVHGASRCGECHNKMYDEWETSAHAKAMTSPLFKASHADASISAHGDDCLRCHAPLVAMIDDPIATEGVTCDVCHTLRDVKATPHGSDFTLAIDDMVKFGPRCDLKDHYFHRMGCSKEHDTSQVCAACHWWEKDGVPIFTEYADWKAGPASPTACQECHMPKSKAAIAEGSPARDGVPHHGLLGFAADLRKRALELTATRTADGLDLALRNVNGGHHVPSGLPERRIVVTAKVGDETQTWELGRVLVDADGKEVPFWRATKVGSDTRIASGATATTSLHFAAAGPADVTVAYRPMSAAVAKQLAQSVEDQPLIHAVVPAGKPVVVKAPPPGKLKK